MTAAILERDAKPTVLKESSVKDIVLSMLGKPADLHRVIVSSVGTKSFRVNVFREIERHQCRITDSFFVRFDGGELVESTPAIIKKY